LLDLGAASLRESQAVSDDTKHASARPQKQQGEISIMPTFRIGHLRVASLAALIVVASGRIAVASVVTTSPSFAAVTLWDQPNGAGHSISFTGTGSVGLASFLVDPANPGLGTWDHAVRSYRANDTLGTLRKTTSPIRDEQFGPNFNIKNAGQFGQTASQLIISWVGWNQHIQSGSIVSWGAELIGAPRSGPFCLDTLAGHVDDFGTPVVILAKCSTGTALSQQWHWENGLLRNLGTNLCMDSSGQFNGFPNTLVVKPCSSDPTYQTEFQSYSFNTQRHQWIALGVSQPLTIVGGFPPSFGETLTTIEPDDSDWDQVFLNYFY
jgi:hypothetical protein